jgi:hypothetical protein
MSFQVQTIARPFSDAANTCEWSIGGGGGPSSSDGSDTNIDQRELEQLGVGYVVDEVDEDNHDSIGEGTMSDVNSLLVRERVRVTMCVGATHDTALRAPQCLLNEWTHSPHPTPTMSQEEVEDMMAIQCVKATKMLRLTEALRTMTNTNSSTVSSPPCNTRRRSLSADAAGARRYSISGDALPGASLQTSQEICNMYL